MRKLLNRLRVARAGSKKHDVTAVLTSCGRHDLLEQTLSSFRQHNTYDMIKELIVIEDGFADPSAICSKYQARLIRPNKKIGHLKALDMLYGEVETDYIFHMEDDWEFYRSGFIEKSKNILEVDPSTITVWLRSWDDTNLHPLIFKSSAEDFAVPDPNEGCFGFTLNPGLRRLSDYRAIKNFASTLINDRHFEIQIATAYKKLGYRGVVLDKTGYIRHIGWDRHVEDVVTTA